MTMQRVPINDAQNEFHFVMNQVCSGLGPVLITGLHGNAVLVSEAEWRKMQQPSPEPASAPAADPGRDTVARTKEAESLEDMV